VNGDISGSSSVLSVKIRRSECIYAPFNVYKSIPEYEMRDFEKSLDAEKRYSSPSGFSTGMLMMRYCSEAICGAMTGRNDTDSVSRNFMLLTKLYSASEPLICALADEWLCDLYLSQGKVRELYDLIKSGYSHIPFASDITVGDYISDFLCGNGNMPAERHLSVMLLLSDYDCRRSHCYIENSKLYGDAMSAVFPAAMYHALEENGDAFFYPKPIKSTRLNFRGLPCSSECSRLLETEYIPYSSNTQLRELVTSVVKHTDNLIRIGLSTKSRLTGVCLSVEYKKLLSDTIRAKLPGFLPAPAKAGRKPKPESEKKAKKNASEKLPEVHEKIDLNIDFSRAKRLEAESWKLTELLGADYGARDISFSTYELYGEYDKTPEAVLPLQADENETEETCNANIPEEWQDFFKSLSNEEKQFLCALTNGLDVVTFSKKRGGMAQGYIDAVNEKASDTYGDIIIENSELIEDYRDELCGIFSVLYDTEVL